MLLNRKNVTKVTIESGRVTGIDFVFKEKKYSAKIAPAEISLESRTEPYDRDHVATRNLRTGEVSWRMDHECGLRGFNSNEHTCYGCTSPLLKLTPENIPALSHAGRYYSPELATILATDIEHYAHKVQERVADILF